MSERDIAREILEGIREIKAFKAGKTNLKTRELKEPAPPKAMSVAEGRRDQGQ